MPGQFLSTPPCGQPSNILRLGQLPSTINTPLNAFHSVVEGCGRLQTRRKEKKNSKRGCPWLPQLPPTWAKPGKSVPRHRAIEEAPQGVVADRDGTCDGDVRRPRRRVRAKMIKWELSGCTVAVTPVSGPKHGAITLFLYNQDDLK